MPQPSRARRLCGAFLLGLLVLGDAARAAAPVEAPVPPPAPRSAGEAPERAPVAPPRPARDPDEPAAPAEAPPPPPLPGTPDRPDGPEPPPETAEPPEAAETAAPEAAETPEAGAQPSPHAVLASPLPPRRPGLSGSTLIGIFALTTGRTALMRFPSGEVRRLSIGDEIDGWRVDAIARDSLRLARGERERTFVLMGN